MKPVHHFSKEYLARSRKMTPKQILAFLKDYGALHAGDAAPSKSRLISLKVPAPLLASFKVKAQLSGVPYQTQIKRLMKDWTK
jgi:hypothetical protein